MSKQVVFHYYRAYETLSDPKKRKLYDRTGLTGHEQDQAGGFEGFGFNPFSASFWGAFAGARQQAQEQARDEEGHKFEDVFKEFESFFSMGDKDPKKGGANGKVKGKDIFQTVDIDFLEAVNGVQKSVTYARSNKCGTCNGSMIKPGTTLSECEQCGGEGKITMLLGSTLVHKECEACNGQGSTYQACLTCNGSGSVFSQVKETISIPKGVDNGMNLRLSKKGNYFLKGENGDLLIKVNVRSHPYFKREGVDIHTEKFVTMT